VDENNGYIIEQILNNLTFENYFGFITILAISAFFGYLSLNIASQTSLKYPSYGYGAVSLLIALTLVIKYVFAGHSFIWDFFIGEIAVLIGGSIIFIFLYISSNKMSSSSRYR
jgi:hypothetical protein